MARALISNAFSLNMLPPYKYLVIKMYLSKLSPDDFCANVRGDVESYIGHQATADLVNSLCGTSFAVNRSPLILHPYQHLYVVMVSERLPEGKVLDKTEVLRMYRDGRVSFIHLWYEIEQ